MRLEFGIFRLVYTVHIQDLYGSTKPVDRFFSRSLPTTPFFYVSFASVTMKVLVAALALLAPAAVSAKAVFAHFMVITLILFLTSPFK